MVLGDGPVTEEYGGTRKFTGPCTFSQGLFGMSNGHDIWYVDRARTASDDGKTWEKAFITIAEAVAAAGPYDTILVKGTAYQEDSGTLSNDYDEAITITAAQIGLRIIGVGNSPEGIAWANGTEEANCLNVYARDCYVSGFRFRPYGAAAYGIHLVTSSDLATNPMGFTVENCIFRSHTTTALAGIGIDSTNDVTIRYCKFSSVVTAVAGYATNHSVLYRLKIHDCLVDDKCTNGFVFDGRSCVIKNNDLAGDLTVAVNTFAVGSAGSKNMVWGHAFPQAEYETACIGSTSDVWFGNISLDTSSSAVHASGWTNTKVYPQT